jgi:hypothetical protein
MKKSIVLGVCQVVVCGGSFAQDVSWQDLDRADQWQMVHVPGVKEVNQKYIVALMTNSLFEMLQQLEKEKLPAKDAFLLVEGTEDNAQPRRFLALWKAFIECKTEEEKRKSIQEWLSNLRLEKRFSRSLIRTLVDRATQLDGTLQGDSSVALAVTVIKKGMIVLAHHLEQWVDKDVLLAQRRRDVDQRGHLMPRLERSRNKSLFQLASKKDIFKATPEEFAGAVHWAHTYKTTTGEVEPITGKGVQVLVLESMPEDGDSAFIERSAMVNADLGLSFAEGAKGQKDRSDAKLHANEVVTRVLGIAPDSQCIVRDTAGDIGKFLKKRGLDNIKIVNASFGYYKTKDRNEALRKIEKIKDLSKDRVFVEAIGNEHEDVAKYNQYIDVELYHDEKFMENAVLVTNINQDFTLHDSSNRPQDAWEFPRQAKNFWGRLFSSGDTDAQKKLIMDNTISALGADVLGFSGPETFLKVTGTSFSAPTVSGALALIEGMGKKEKIELSAQELKGILLSSARQEAFIPAGGGFAGTYIVPVNTSEKALQRLRALNPSGGSGTLFYKRFDPAQYGRGFLDIRRMIMLAEVYFQTKKKWPKGGQVEEILEEAIFHFGELERQTLNNAAKLIQERVRYWKGEKSMELLTK